MLWEIIIVLILVIFNGLFSMSEMALVTVRKTCIDGLTKQGNNRAKIIQLLQQNPESLFATIQIGISVITIAASAFAGSIIAQNFALSLGRVNIAFISNNAEIISFITVVVLLSYVTITFGEVIPKSLGLRYAEPLALYAAYPVWWLSKISSGLIKTLNFSSNLFLKLFKDKTSFAESRLSTEEIRSLISEGRKAGTIEAHEDAIIQNVFDFSDLSVGKIMVPRTKMTALSINQPPSEIFHKAIESGYSRIPVYQDSLNNITGILYTKRLLAKFNEANQNLNLQDFLVPPYFVPDSMKINEVLQRLQRKRAHMAMVTDEHGEIAGLVTLEDVLEEIVGDISDETDEADKNIKREGSDFMVLGGTPVVDFNKHFKTELPENGDFNTVSGFILEKLGRFAKVGDVVEYKDIQFTVKEITKRTVKSAKVTRARQDI